MYPWFQHIIAYENKPCWKYKKAAYKQSLLIADTTMLRWLLFTNSHQRQLKTNWALVDGLQAREKADWLAIGGNTYIYC